MANIREEEKVPRLRAFYKRRDHKGSGKKIFWIWVGYQAVKGILSVSFIWIPLIYFWLMG